MFSFVQLIIQAFVLASVKWFSRTINVNNERENEIQLDIFKMRFGFEWKNVQCIIEIIRYYLVQTYLFQVRDKITSLTDYQFLQQYLK